MKNIFDIFYNHIILEAAKGQVNCLINFNMPFFTYIVEDDNYIFTDFLNNDKLFIPTLIIKNKETFNNLLKEYVSLALKYYSDNEFLPEVLEGTFYDDKHCICKEKMLMTLLWSNATFEDFQNPTLFLQKRTCFLKKFQPEEKDLGYSEILKGNIIIKIKKDSIFNETPAFCEIKVISDNQEEYLFPHIKFGIEDDKATIYAIQNPRQKNITKYGKTVNRTLFKIGQGFNSQIDNYELYEEGNLKDITASFLVASNILIFWLKSKGITNFLISPSLIERWNAKYIASHLKAHYYNYDEFELQNILKEQENIWQNTNDKLIRTFARLVHHHESIEIYSDFFANLHLKVFDFINCNNDLLNETGKLAMDSLKEEIIKEKVK